MAGHDNPSYLEDLFGWIYFAAWGISGYPQIYLIFQQGTTEGLSPDFVIINCVGFISYSIFTFVSFTTPAVSSAYILHTGFPPQINLSDVIFAVHGACLTSLVAAQMLYYPPRILPRTPTTIICVACQVAVFVGLGMCSYGHFDWYVYLRIIGMVKVLASLFKLIPQAVLNHVRRSTVGWSFSSILFDTIGGTFSIAQQVARCFRVKSLAPFTSNYAKTFLAVESLLFDIFFIAQHFIFHSSQQEALHEESKVADERDTPDAEVCPTLSST